MEVVREEVVVGEVEEVVVVEEEGGGGGGREPPLLFISNSTQDPFSERSPLLPAVRAESDIVPLCRLACIRLSVQHALRGVERTSDVRAIA